MFMDSLLKIFVLTHLFSSHHISSSHLANLCTWSTGKSHFAWKTLWIASLNIVVLSSNHGTLLCEKVQD